MVAPMRRSSKRGGRAELSLIIFQADLTPYGRVNKESNLFEIWDKEHFIRIVKENISGVLDSNDATNILIVLPELSSFPKLEDLAEKIRYSNSGKNISFILGSYYITRGRRFTHLIPVLSYRREKFYFVKKILSPYERSITHEYDDRPGFIENIRTTDRNRVFEILPSVRAGVLVCSEFYSKELRESLLSMRPDILFVISFNNQSGEFYNIMESIFVDIARDLKEETPLIVYVNSFFHTYDEKISANGGSAIYGITDKIEIEKLNRLGVRDEGIGHKYQIIKLPNEGYVLNIKLRIPFKKPERPLPIGFDSNILRLDRIVGGITLVPGIPIFSNISSSNYERLEEIIQILGKIMKSPHASISELVSDLRAVHAYLDKITEDLKNPILVGVKFLIKAWLIIKDLKINVYPHPEKYDKAFQKHAGEIPEIFDKSALYLRFSSLGDPLATFAEGHSFYSRGWAVFFDGYKILSSLAYPPHDVKLYRKIGKKINYLLSNMEKFFELAHMKFSSSKDLKFFSDVSKGDSLICSAILKFLSLGSKAEKEIEKLLKDSIKKYLNANIPELVIATTELWKKIRDKDVHGRPLTVNIKNLRVGHGKHILREITPSLIDGLIVHMSKIRISDESYLLPIKNTLESLISRK